MPRLIALQSIADPSRGPMCVVEAEREVPFAIRRIFYMYDLPVGIERGGHAHRAQHQFLIGMHGSLAVQTWSTRGAEDFLLEHPRQGLHAPPLTWLVIRALDPAAICVVLCSDRFDEADYIRNRAEFDRLIAR